VQCRDVLELADPYLSGQLLVETTHDVVRHLETCAGCRAEIESRRALRRGLQTAFARAPELAPAADFAAKLRRTLQSAEPESVSRRRVLRSAWALAAGIVLAAGGGIWMRTGGSRSRLAALAREAAGDHQNCAVAFNLAERPLRLHEAARRFGEPYAALSTFEAPPDVSGPLEAIERHSCMYDGRRFGHVVYRYRGTVASLLLTEGETRDAPEIEMHEGRYHVAPVPLSRFAAFVVSDLGAEPTLRLARALAEPLARHLGA
jgi:hypothetical protein